MLDLLENVIVGSGIGGSLISALLKNTDHILFEQDKNLGGCASTFKRHGKYYNAGATTLVGYEKDHVLKNIFDSCDIKPNIQKSDIAIRIIQGEKTVDRVKDFEHFLEQVELLYPHPNNRVFWEKIKQIDEKFWQLQNIYFGKYKFSRYIQTSKFIKELFKVFGFEIFQSAKGFIDKNLYNIPQNYQDFIDAQLLITVQTTSKNISLLSLALGLAYPFHDVYYPNGGMGSVISQVLEDVNTHTKEQIQKVIQHQDHYEIISNKTNYKTKNVILNSSIYDSGKLFDDKKIKSYYEKFSFSDQSAFVVYLYITNKEKFLHHYQIILDKLLPNSISKSFFVSFSDQDDPKFHNNENGYSITISTHTKANYWKMLSPEQYEIQKYKLQNFIVEKFLEYFDTISKKDITKVFSATSITFHRYISRYNCGGKAIGLKNALELPSCQTPFKGLYNIGDTVFAGQGWPGVALGVDVLHKELSQNQG